MLTALRSLLPGRRLGQAMALGMALMAVGSVAEATAVGYANPTGVAVVIGNKDYRNERVPEVAYAHRDADAFRHYALDVLGFDPKRVFDLRDATQAMMFTWFGNRDSHEGRLWRYLHPRHGSDVVVFYSGHGVPGLKDRRGYLLPSDADPDTPEINGYPIDLLYANLGKLRDAKSVQVFLDACFSGDSDRGMLVRSASPVFVQASLPDASGEKLTVLSAASGTEVASWDENARHGMFTHHLLNALYGDGDLDGNGQVTAAEAKIYLDDTMTIAARVEFGRYQNASLVGHADTVLASAGVGGVFPARPELDASGADAAVVVAEDDETGEPEVVVEEPSSPSPSIGDAESVEKALGLTHAQRVLVQRGLGQLDHDVGVADGVFGRRTRGGIVSYQREKGLAETGYLTREQYEGLVALGEEAQRRAEAERVERERKEVARRAESEERIQRERREAEAARRADDGAFGRAKSEGTVESYASYLEGYPSGRHVVEARRLRDEAAERGRGPVVGERFRDCDGTWCPELVVVPSGSFMMGSPSGEAGRDDTLEGPLHRVRIAERFAVGVTEVTRGQWSAFVSETGHSKGDSCRTYESGGWRERGGRGWRNPGYSQSDGHPVVCVSWEDAQAYVGWLSSKTGKSYRLLSESEWEYVARAGTSTARYWGEGEANQCRHVNGADRTLKERYSDWNWTTSGCRDGHAHTAPVGSFVANGYGLHDVLGNVWEWTMDCWNESYAGSPTDGSAWLSGFCNYRVLRGGSWNDYPSFLRSAFRYRNTSGYRYDSFGFRVARTLTP